MDLFTDLNIELNFKGKRLNTTFHVYQNENVKQIKEKMFAFLKSTGGYLWLPDYILLKTPSGVIVDSANLSGDNIFYIEHLFDFLTEREQTFSTVQKAGFICSRKLFEFAKTIVNYQHSKESKLQFNLYPEQYTDSQRIIKLELDDITRKQKNLNTKYTKTSEVFEKNLLDNEPVKNKQFNNYFDNVVEVLNLETFFKNENDQPSRLNLFNLFNSIDLQNGFVAIILNGKFLQQSEPLVKLNKELPTGYSKTDVKRWLVNEKKKNNVAIFKRFKGLTVKYIYKGLLFSIQINSSKDVSVVFEKQDQISDTIQTYQELITLSKEAYLGILKDLKLSQPSSVNESVVSFSANVQVNQRLRKNAFADFALQKTVATNLFSLKDTVSKDPISAFYTLNNKEQQKGITVNIKDDTYTLGKSVLTIFDCLNLQQFKIILKFVFLIDLYNQNSNTKEDVQKTKIKSTIKDLKKQGVEIISTNCQQPRQPQLYNKELNQVPSKESYVLNWNDKKYICPKPEYRFPGFTNKNIVCCFKNDQRRSAKYINNLKSEQLDIIVQPSNYPIKLNIKDPSKKGKATINVTSFLMKVVSGLDISDHPYYYLDFVDDILGLVKLENQKLIEDLKTQDKVTKKTLWLEPVALAQLTTAAAKNKCNKPPDFTKGFNDFCSKYKTEKFFGYTSSSIPCCSEKPRERLVNITNETIAQRQQHILGFDKLLEPSRLGQNSLLFGEIFKSGSEFSDFYRLGIQQNSETILHAVFTALTNKSKWNTFEKFKEQLISFIKKNNLFKKILNGNLLKSWVSEDLFINDLLQGKNISHVQYIDLIKHALKLNILIIQYTTEIDSKLICTDSFVQEYPSIVLFQRADHIDLIVEKKNQEVFNAIFVYSKYKFIQVLYKYQKKACVKYQFFPDSYTFTDQVTIQQLQNVSKIKYQIINTYNKVEWVQLTNNLILPVQETGIQDNIEIKKLKEVDLLTLKQTVTKLNKLIDIFVQYRIIGVVQTVDPSFDCLLLNCGLWIPILKTKDVGQYTLLDDVIYPIFYYSDTPLQIGKIEVFEKYNTLIFQGQTLIGKYLSKNNQIRQSIEKIVLDTSSSSLVKFNTIYEILKPKVTGLISDFILKITIMNIIGDPIHKNILNNIVSQFKYNTDQLSIGTDQVLITNLQELLLYVAKN